MDETKDIAILIFSNSHIHENKKKKITHSNVQNKKIIQSLFHHTIQTVRNSNIPYFIESNHTQIGADFGERISNSINKILRYGYDKVIVIGNDCPTISEQLIKKAKQNLITQNSILGPTKDGGVYLIGISKKQFQKDQFSSLPWQKENLFEELASSLECSYFLQEESDIDTSKDWEVFLSLETPLPIALRWIHSKTDALFSKYLLFFVSNYIQKINLLRAPPYSI